MRQTSIETECDEAPRVLGEECVPEMAPSKARRWSERDAPLRCRVLSVSAVDGLNPAASPMTLLRVRGPREEDVDSLHNTWRNNSNDCKNENQDLFSPLQLL